MFWETQYVNQALMEMLVMQIKSKTQCFYSAGCDKFQSTIREGMFDKTAMACNPRVCKLILDRLCNYISVISRDH